MGDTVTITVTEDWQEFFSDLGKSFSFSNQGPSTVFIRESPTKPDSQILGFPFKPDEGGAATVETSPFWVRSLKTSTSETAEFHFGTVLSGTGGPTTLPVETITTSPLNLVVSNNLVFFVVNSASAFSIVIPDNVDQPFPIGAEMEFIRDGIGTVTFSTPGVAILQSRAGLVMINAQYSAVTLKKIGTDEWRLMGDLA